MTHAPVDPFAAQLASIAVARLGAKVRQVIGDCGPDTVLTLCAPFAQQLRAGRTPFRLPNLHQNAIVLRVNGRRPF